MSLDPLDLRLLAALQTDAQVTADRLAGQLNLSASQISRRRHRLEAEGYIRAYVARLAPSKVGLTVQAFMHVHMATHASDAAKQFVRLTEHRAEVTGAWTLTGEADYLLRVFCSDLAELNRFVQDVLLPHPSVARVQSQIVMEELKADAPLPL